MGKTVVEKILARAAGLPAVTAGDVVEPRVDVAMSHENAALVINQFLEIYEGTGVPAHALGRLEDRDHLRPPRPGRVAEDRVEPEEDPRVRRRARDLPIPRHPRRRRRHLPPDPPRVRLREARAGRRRHRLAHDEPRRPRRLLVRHRRDRDGLRLDARRRPQRRGPADDQGRGDGRVPAARRPEGPDPPPRRQADRPGSQLPRPRVPRRDDAEDVDLRAPRRLQHVGRGGRDVGHRPGRRGDAPLPARGGGRHRPDRARRPRPGRRLRAGRHGSTSRPSSPRSPARTPSTTSSRSPRSRA